MAVEGDAVFVLSPDAFMVLLLVRGGVEETVCGANPAVHHTTEGTWPSSVEGRRIKD